MRRIVAAVAVAAAALGVAVAEAWPQAQISQGVASANAKAGHPPNVLAAGFSLRPVVQGSDQLENPTGVYDTFGFLADGAPPNLEATKTEPDQNTYLVFKQSPGGPTPGYDYGHHFLFQFHETGNDQAFVTRINLDVSDPTHRITLLTPGDGKTTGFNDGDGSTWDPFAKAMLYTQEDGAEGGVIEQSPFWTSSTTPPATTLYGSIGRGGFEGIHPDGKGNILLIEDAGGQTVPIDPNDPTSPKHREAAELVRLPLRAGPPGRPHQGQAAGAPGDDRQAGAHLHLHGDSHELPVVARPGVRRRVLAGAAQAALGQLVPRQVGDDPRHLDRRHGAVRRQRRREGHQQRGQQGHPVPAAGERLVPARHRLQDVLLRPDR